MSRRRSPPQGRRVHHVVVVKGGQVDHLDERGRLPHVGVQASEELGREHCQQRTHPLAAGVCQVPRRGVGEVVAYRERVEEPLLHVVEGLGDVGGQRLVGGEHVEACGKLDGGCILRGHGLHRGISHRTQLYRASADFTAR